MSLNFTRMLAAMALGSLSIAATAAPVTPTYTTFSNLAAATYGGSGIPTDPSAITTFGTLTLGMAATQRFVGPNLGNNGAGTYFANPGISSGNASTWNFDFYLSDSQGPLNAGGRTYKLFYDFDPGVGTDQSQLGVWNLTPLDASATVQDSQNLGFSFLASSIPPFITPPPGSFNALAQGEYSFALVAYRDGVEFARSAILVDVGAVPEPASLALLAAGLGGLGAARRRARK